MSEENTNATGQNDDLNQKLETAVGIASDLLVVNRDQKSAAIVLAGMSDEEQAGITGFISKVKAQQIASKNVYGLVMAKAKERNAGKPTRSRSKKADAGAGTDAGTAKGKAK